MIYLKTPEEVRKIEYVNQLGTEFLLSCYEYLKPGIATIELEDMALKFCEKHKGFPAFKGYKGFPHALCVSINEEVIHGFPSNRVVKDGDLVKVDFGLFKDGFCSDAAFTKGVGDISNNLTILLSRGLNCLKKAITKALPGNRFNDISVEIQAIEDKHFSVCRDYVGHGVGFSLHEEPKVYNFVDKFRIDWQLKPGMVFTIEPIIFQGDYKVKTAANGWTVLSATNVLSVHFEHSIAVIPNGYKVLSRLNDEMPW